ncbi:MAG: DUF5110 domain-containing protein, partial [Sedimentisphaerales bacterium]|nr:DUF5110 domain-containing protein [Sedimentisphaerales bacterium]
DYINVEKGLDYVKCTAVAADSPAKDWTAQTVEGAMTLASRHADSSLMHIENRKGYVQYSPAQTTNADGRTMDKWLSCRWLEAKDASDFFSDNRRWLPHPESETAAWAICDTPRYVPAKWGYNPAPDNSKNNGWDLDNHAADVYVFLPRGDSKRLRRDYLTLTGRTDLIPMHAFGAWDSRYYPYTQEYASAKIDRYRSEQIPLDVFVVDTDWRVGASHGYGVATNLFPDMKGFIQEAHDKNLRVVFNDHPEPQAGCLDAKEVNYRNEGLRSLFDIGLDFWWFDRNWHTSLLPPAGINKEVFGMYIFHWVTQDYYPNRRPFLMANCDGIDNGIINRAPNIAAHRYNLQWTGDTFSDYGSLRREIRNAVYSGVFAPFAYTSTDLGGHMGKLSLEQYSRWVQFGALSPNFRLHCGVGYTRDPWDYGAEGIAVVRDYVSMRMRLIPLFYNWARENYDNGEPILRRCDLDYPEYEQAKDDLQYLLGDSILVAPVCYDTTATVPTKWFDNAVKTEYFGNKDLAGTAVVSSVSKDINFNWRQQTPAAGVPADNFSARFSGSFTVAADYNVLLGVTSDDGCRLWIDNELVLDKWVNQGSTTHWSAKELVVGKSYSFKLEYFDGASDAVCMLNYRKSDVDNFSERALWMPPGLWVDSWTGEKVVGPKDVVRRTPVVETPLYVKAGSIIALTPDMQHTNEKPWDNLTLDVYPAAANAASSRLYEDDRMSNDYRDGACRMTYFTAAVNNDNKTVKVDISAAKGTYKNALASRAWTIRMRQPLDWNESATVKSVSVDGKNVSFEIVARDEQAMPFAVTGGSRDADVVLINLDSASVNKARTVEVKFAAK